MSPEDREFALLVASYPDEVERARVEVETRPNEPYDEAPLNRGWFDISDVRFPLNLKFDGGMGSSHDGLD